MKGILCLECVDFKALNPDPNEIVVCNCGNVGGSWTNPERGWMRIKALNKENARVIGLHNGFLKLALSVPKKAHRIWNQRTKELLADSDGYLFHPDFRNCPIVIISPGESNDVVWWEDYKNE